MRHPVFLPLDLPLLIWDIARAVWMAMPRVLIWLEVRVLKRVHKGCQAIDALATARAWQLYEKRQAWRERNGFGGGASMSHQSESTKPAIACTRTHGVDQFNRVYSAYLRVHADAIDGVTRTDDERAALDDKELEVLEAIIHTPALLMYQVNFKVNILAGLMGTGVFTDEHAPLLRSIQNDLPGLGNDGQHLLPRPPL